MSDVRIVRETAKQKIQILNTATESDRFVTGRYVKGSYVVPAALTGNAISYEVSNDDGATFKPLNDIAGVALAAVDVTSIKGEGVTLPIEIFSYQYGRLVSGAAEGADRDFEICTSG